MKEEQKTLLIAIVNLLLLIVLLGKIGVNKKLVKPCAVFVLSSSIVLVIWTITLVVRASM